MRRPGRALTSGISTDSSISILSSTWAPVWAARILWLEATLADPRPSSPGPTPLLRAGIPSGSAAHNGASNFRASLVTCAALVGVHIRDAASLGTPP